MRFEAPVVPDVRRTLTTSLGNLDTDGSKC
jgi:hypothetical protein